MTRSGIFNLQSSIFNSPRHCHLPLAALPRRPQRLSPLRSIVSNLQSAICNHPFLSLLLASSILGLGSSVFGSLCVWRFPDRDLKEMFNATSYQTVFVDISPEHEKKIEARIGTSLDPDETQFKFFPVFRQKERVGTVVTHLGKGQYGAIEVVVALVVDKDGRPRVKQVKIQRDREKASAALRSARFLAQFAGKNSADRLTVGKDLATAARGAERSSQTVATAVRKALVAYEELMMEGK